MTDNHDEVCYRAWSVGFAVKSSSKGVSADEILKTADKFHRYLLGKPGAELKSINSATKKEINKKSICFISKSILHI